MGRYALKRRIGVDPRVRFWEHVSKTETCWLWIGQRKKGYGYFRGGRAHRLSYVWARGPVPIGLEIDHLCRVRSCVNPSHLEAVTPKENNRRSTSPTALNAVKTTCKNGHPFSGENLYRAPKGRDCRACVRDAGRRWRARKRQEREP